MNLTQTQVNQTLLSLGYGSNLTKITDAQILLIRNHLSQSDFPQELVNRFTQIQAELAALETQRAEIMELIYVSSTAQVQLNPSGGIVLLNRRGSTLLQELANLFDIPIRFNRYLGCGSGNSSVSYW